MPSTTSSSVSKDFASSTVITPSLPTFFIASARNFPISTSPLAEIVPTWAISSLEVTFFEFFFRSSTTASTARSMPRLRSIGFIPAATAFEPSFTIACARTVAVVVPSPAKSDDFEATSRTICAPIFSNLSSSSISLATVTPSLVMRGAPYDLASTTLRPLGPSVTLTASARISAPRSMRSRASPLNLTSLAAMFSVSWLSGLLLLGGLIDHAHDVGLLHDQEILAIELDLGTRPFSEQHAVAGLDVERVKRAALVARAGAGGDDFAFHRLLLHGVGDDDAAGGFRLLLDTTDQDAILQWTQFHGGSSGRISAEIGTVGPTVPTHKLNMGRSPAKYNQRNARRIANCRIKGLATVSGSSCYSLIGRFRLGGRHIVPLALGRREAEDLG